MCSHQVDSDKSRLKMTCENHLRLGSMLLDGVHHGLGTLPQLHAGSLQSFGLPSPYRQADNCPAGLPEQD